MCLQNLYSIDERKLPAIARVSRDEAAVAVVGGDDVMSLSMSCQLNAIENEMRRLLLADKNLYRGDKIIIGFRMARGRIRNQVLPGDNFRLNLKNDGAKINTLTIPVELNGTYNPEITN